VFIELMFLISKKANYSGGVLPYKAANIPEQI
jgi:hypothetical protein